MEPAWLITDEAVTLVLHAKSEMDAVVASVAEGLQVGSAGILGGTFESSLWRQEAAALRVISTIEAFVDAAAEYWCELAGEPAPPESSFISWPKRKSYYSSKHAIDLQGLNGWPLVDAGVDLRNCLAHGLGNLTHRLVNDSDLGRKLSQIHVGVAGNRMHPTHLTIGKLSDGCISFVLALEAELVQKL